MDFQDTTAYSRGESRRVFKNLFQTLYRRPWRYGSVRCRPSRAESSRAEPARRLARKVIVTDNVAENKSCIKLTADYHDYIILRILVYFLLGLFQSLGIPLTSRTLFRINQCSLCAIASYCLRNKFPGNSTSTTS